MFLSLLLLRFIVITQLLTLQANMFIIREKIHIEFDCQKVCEATENGMLKTMFVHPDHQLSDILTKALYSTPFRKIISKMGVQYCTPLKGNINLYYVIWFSLVTLADTLISFGLQT